MEKFTVKDFILYNNPCFSCDNKISLNMRVLKVRSDIPNNYNTPPIIIKPILSNNFIEIDLRITYRDVLKLKICLTDNHFEITNIVGLTDYLREANLFLESYCDKCYSCFTSKLLTFNMTQQFINPIELKTEYLTINNDNYAYYISTDFEKSQSIVDIFTLNGSKIPIHFDMPIFPLSKFKTKTQFIKKMKVYISFS